VANFNVSTFPNLTGFVTSGSRTWTTSGGYVYPTESLTDYGFLINSTTPAVNGFVTAEYRDFNYQTSDVNAIVLRFVDPTNFLYCTINSSNGSPYSTQYVTFGRGLYNSIPAGTKIELKDKYGVTIQEAPSNTSHLITPSGKIRIDIADTNNYTVNVYNSSDVFICSGSYIDTASTSAYNGKVGFFHNTDTSTGFGDGYVTSGGWKSLAWTDIGYEASIQHFTSNKVAVESGTVTTFSWAVDGGISPSNATFNGASVALSGTSAVTITGTSAYTLSAYNSYGHTSATLTVPVYANVPSITYLSASTSAISPGITSVVSFQTNKATSAYYSDGLSAYPLSIATSGIYSSFFNVTPSASTVYTMSAMYAPNQAVITANTSVMVYDNPVINTFSNTGPVCSGTSADITYNISNATSAFFDNGIGWVTPVSAGTINIPSVSASTWYGVSAYNPLGQSDIKYSQVIMSQNAPVIAATVMWNNAPVTSGYVLSAYSLAGTTIMIDASQTYDVDGHGVQYTYIVTQPSSTHIYSSQLSTHSWTIGEVGSYNVTVSATDGCGFASSLDIVDFSLSSYIPPVPVISGGGTITTSGMYVVSGSGSYDEDGYVPLTYNWYQGSSTTPISTDADLSATISTYGTFRYYFVVTDTMGLSARSSAVSFDYYPEDDLFLDVDAGQPQTFCLSAGQSTPTITLDGSKTVYHFGNEHPMVYQWDISSLSAESWYTTSYIYGVTSAIPGVSGIGNRPIYLTVTATDPDVIGGSYTNTGVTYINTSSKPLVSAGYIYDGVYRTSGMDILLACPNTSGTITLSASCSNYSDGDITCKWYKKAITGGSILIANGLSADIKTTKSIYREYFCDISENLNGCKTRSTENLKIKTDLQYDLLKINSFVLDKYRVDVLPGNAGSVTASWNVTSADTIWIDVNGSSTSVSGVSSHPITIYEDSIITLSAVMGNCVKTESRKVELFDDFSVSKQHDNMVKVLAPAVIRYGTDRKINLVDFIPDYIQNRSGDLVQLVKFYEDYMNSMFVTDGDNGNDNSILPTSTALTVTNEYNLSGSVLSAAPYTYTVDF